LIKLHNNHGAFGIVANPNLSFLVKSTVGSFPNSWGYSTSNGCLHNLLIGNTPQQWLPYGENLTSGDVLTVRVNLIDKGVL
jgi:hypothetical protein